MNRLFALTGGGALVALGLWAISSSMAFSQQPTQGRAPRVVNVTPDSEKGWVPTEAMEQQARKAAIDYLADEDSGRMSEAYARFTDVNREHQPFAEFSANVRRNNGQLGAVIEHLITTVTWTKNLAQAPLPGVYAAMDLISRYANADRHCGYLVLYQAPSSGKFGIMREEINYMENAMLRQRSPAEVDAAWAKTSANCPNYRPAPAGPLPEASSPTIEYPNVGAALLGLHAKPGVKFTEQAGWIIANDEATYTTWSFPPKGNPAYPAAVKRELVRENDQVFMKMAVHCEASKQACDELVRSFQDLNDKMTASLRNRK